MCYRLPIYTTCYISYIMNPQIYTDQDFIDAVRRVLERPAANASDVADVLGCNPRYATVRLKSMVDKGLLEGEKKSTGWGFRLK